jgi:hypothetical protein
MVEQGMTYIGRGVFAAIAAFSINTASAQELSFNGDLSLGKWQNENGGTGLPTTNGINDAVSRNTARLNLSVARNFAAFTGQVDLGYQAFSAAPDTADTDDATNHTVDLTLRGLRDFGGYRVGAFIGAGRHDDYGDSDRQMSYEFVGVETSKAMGFGDVFGQAGYLDSDDEYGEGLQRAYFLRLGATYTLGKFALTGALSAAEGRRHQTDDTEGRIYGLELAVEHPIAETGLVAFSSYEWSRATYSDNGAPPNGDEFQTLYAGIKFDLGGKAQHAKKLPNIGQWVAYQANEIE